MARNYRYNGVELPALPDWDKDKYPYAMLWGQVYEGINGMSSMYELVIRAEPFTRIAADDTIELFLNNDESWKEYDGYEIEYPDIYGNYQTEWIKSFPSIYLSEISKVCVWTNENIYNDDGSLFFAASEPVPVSTVVLKDFLNGFALGLMEKPLPYFVMSGEPIAYSYNGVILPALPEWDRERYPYAWMTDAKRNLVYFTDKPMMRCTGANGGEVFAINGNNHAGQEVSVVMYQLSADGTKFEMAMKYDNTDALLLVTQNAPLWTNYDVIDVDDGSVCFAASDPVPLYKFLGYSYNGTILPKLPEWDKEAYPYANINHIVYNLDKGIYHIVNLSVYSEFSIRTTLYGEEDKIDIIGGGLTTQLSWYEHEGTPKQWGELSQSSSLNGPIFSELLWANADIYGTDGNLFLAASEPIPIYE